MYGSAFERSLTSSARSRGSASTRPRGVGKRGPGGQEGGGEGGGGLLRGRGRRVADTSGILNKEWGDGERARDPNIIQSLADRLSCPLYGTPLRWLEPYASDSA